LPAAGDGMGVQTQKIAQQCVAAMADSEGLQSRKQPALLFVEQTIEQEDGGLEFVGRELEGGGVDGQRKSLGTAAARVCWRRRAESMAV
jgi:hypothetical protein